MRVNIGLYSAKDFYLMTECYDKNNRNHILVEPRRRLDSNDFLERERIGKALLHVNGDVNLFLSCVRHDDKLIVDDLKYIVGALSTKPNVRNVNIKVIVGAPEYEYYRVRIRTLCYSIPVSYSDSIPERLILRTKVVKFLGVNVAGKVIGVLLLIKKIKQNLI
ncbi:hypothetical protein R0914_20835 [Escherichia coli]|uniref:hypothetical protein n=1 Tax=Escherichia coli TaxID=562 RepID=UPI00094455BB|nr:hypothetical protein [Escherichia coli]EHM8972881.1 hypothetical protein [Escherichia coli]OKV35212.1 hypothetical protein AWP49_05660 [Escherichia coli]OKX69643.1 hypothetical protein AWP95_12600 [Escherichia coli]